MNRRIHLILIMLTAFALSCLSSCKSNAADEEPLCSDSANLVTADNITQEESDEEEWDNWLEAYQAEEAEQAIAQKASSDEVSTPKQTQQTAQRQSSPSLNGKKIYISTYGAQGQVWGYVVMNGNSGTGTIHDADENTLSIRVTRHGNELFGIDQNSRQYVFKI